MLWRQTTTIVLRERMPAAAIWETTEAVWTLCKSRLEQHPRWVALAGIMASSVMRVLPGKVHKLCSTCEGTSQSA